LETAVGTENETVSNIYASEPAKILKIRKHTDQEWSFSLAFDAAEKPGRFVMVSLPHTGEVPISISGFSEGAIELTIRKVGDVTAGLFTRSVGDSLHIRGPYGEGFPLDVFDGRPLLIVAGGSGIAAVKSLLAYYTNQEAMAVKTLDLVVGFRSPRHVLFKRELKAWNKRGSVVVTVDKTEDDYESWAGGIGFVVDYIKHVEGVGAMTQVVLVGPPMMMTNTVRELLNNGVLEENIWLSFERHMQCGVGKCGHCRIRDKYVCLDGPVFNYVEARSLID
jgi:anaerobic sulfite reductase subunit B